jgi:hypothetical protein
MGDGYLLTLVILPFVLMDIEIAYERSFVKLVSGDALRECRCLAVERIVIVQMRDS